MKKLDEREKEQEGSLRDFLTLSYETKNVRVFTKNEMQYVKGSRGHHTFFLAKPIFFGKFYF